MPQPQSTLPEFFKPMLEEQYGPSYAEMILNGCATTRSVTLRANTLLATREEVAKELDGAGIAWSGVEWYEDAFVVEEEREDALRALDVYCEGKIYLQSLSAMIPALALGAQPGDDVLDMCAAPGGKTTQILALANGGAYATACEMHAPRAEKLEHNLRKLGAGNVTVMRTDSRLLDDFFSFDRVLLDAPCSGSGTLNVRDPKLPKRFTQKLIAKSVKSQQALFRKALSLLRPQGTLVYATCSVLAQENEEIVTQGLAAARRRGTFEVKPIELAGLSELPVLPCKLEGALCLAPTEHYEGFFVTKIKRCE